MADSSANELIHATIGHEFLGAHHIRVYIAWSEYDLDFPSLATAIKSICFGSCKRHAQSLSALLADLKQRGMLADTLVFLGVEFGRTAGSRSGNAKS